MTWEIFYILKKIGIGEGQWGRDYKVELNSHQQGESSSQSVTKIPHDLEDSFFSS